MSRWFRMYDDVINDPKVMRLAPAMRWQWVAVLCAASKNGGAVPSVADLAFSLRMSEDEASAILGALQMAGLVDDVEGGLVPHNWEGRQYQSDTSAERMRRHRDKKRGEQSDVTSNVTSDVTSPVTSDVTVTVQNRTEADTDQKEVSRPKDRPERVPSRFDEFWLAYPRRDGPNPRKPAEVKFNSLVKTGLDPQMMIDAAKKLAADEGARGNIGTRFIPQAVTWLNQNRWTDHAAVSALLSMQSAEFTIEDAVKQWARLGRWPRGLNFGPEPGMSGCLASVELLAKYGLAIDGRKLAAVAA